MKVLIVVDMLNDFVDEGGKLNFAGARLIAPFVKRRVERYRNEGNFIIFLRDYHKKDDLEFKRHPEHAVEETWGSEIIPELDADYTEMQTIIMKQRYSGFFNTDLDDLLKRLDKRDCPYCGDDTAGNIEMVEVVGVCTSICVMDTVGGLTNRDYNIVVPKAGVADFDPTNHITALNRMETLYGAKII